MNPQDFYRVAYDYTVRFYPRYFTWIQFQIACENMERQGKSSGANQLTGPHGMGPEYKVVVAINDDTIYCEGFLDVSTQPVILTIPPYQNSYSVLQLDVYGSVISTALSQSPPSAGATYAFTSPDYAGELPAGAVKIPMLYPFTIIAIRIDKHSSGNVPLVSQAEAFRTSLRMQTLDAYNQDPSGGNAIAAPLSFFAPSVKLMADEGIAFAAEAWLATVQEAMASPMTEPLTEDDRALMQQFDAVFAEARADAGGTSPLMAEVVRGAQAAHASLINRWQSRRGPTNWIHFNNIGDWGTNYLDRAALTEYIQLGNGRTAAYYANAFVDGSGLPLDGNFSYSITFPQGQPPAYKRFWSMTAYTPEYVELVPNSADKYVVASYTPGLVYDNGSVTIHFHADPPFFTDQANWLPVPKGPFSLLFRVYGPENPDDFDTYAPPAIVRRVV